MVACFGGGSSDANDGGVLDAMVDAARDVVGMETPDALAQDASSGCMCPPPDLSALTGRIAALEARPAGVPTGTVVAYAGSPMSIPDGWALCDGRAVPRSGANATLFAAIGTAHGAGDMVGTFNLPDYRGRFLRGQDMGSMRDPERATRTAAAPGGGTGDAIGTVQGHAFFTTGRQFLSFMFGASDPPTVLTVAVVPMGAPGASIFGSGGFGGTETRPINVSVNYLIKL